MVKKIVLAAAAIVLFSSASFAEMRFSVANAGMVDRRGMQYTPTVMVKAEQRVTDRLSVGFATYFMPSDTMRLGSVEGVVNYDMKPVDSGKEIKPYFGIGYGFHDIDATAKNFVDDLSVKTQYGGQVGVRIDLNKKFSVFSEVNYRTQGKLDEGAVLVFFGMSLAN